MKFFILLNLFYLCISSNEYLLNGVYNIIIDNLYLSYSKSNITGSAVFTQNTLFRIINLNDSIFDKAIVIIEDINTKCKLIISDNNELNCKVDTDYLQIWSFLLNENNRYILKNVNNSCFIKLNEEKFYCEKIPFYKATSFLIKKIFTEVNESEIVKNKELLNKEPVDVLIKYIDLRDKNLTRKGIRQIEKDYDNEELRYAVRSILNYIPWIRKIFILMPNEKVRYFKEKNLIKEKIVYIKDKDILGYDSSNSNSFQFRIYKMKKFGISNNIIVMDDDCFITNKLEKNDFFYVEHGKVVPAIITSDFISINRSIVKNQTILYEQRAKSNKVEQNNYIFEYSRFLTFSFILNIFNVSFEENIIIPKFTHNAIPANLNDIKEIYDLVYTSKYKYPTLDCKYRAIGYIQFQIFIVSYTFIKYNRKVNNIPYNYINIGNTLKSDYKSSLLCINKGSKHYPILISYQAKIVMEYLFPNPSPYEIIDYSLINLSYFVVKSLIKKKHSNKKLYIFNNFIDIKFNIFLFLLLLIIKINIKIYIFIL